MFDIGGSEIVFVLILALLVMGPQNLPKVARAMAQVASQFRRVTNEFKNAIDDEVRNLEIKEREDERRQAGRDGEVRIDALPPETVERTPAADDPESEWDDVERVVNKPDAGKDGA